MKVAVFDTESNGFLESSPNGEEADTLWCIAYTIRGDNGVCFLHEPDDIQQGLDNLHEMDVLVGHNIIKHDLPLMKKLYGWEPKSHQVIIDTLVFSRMLNPKRPIPAGYKGQATHSIEAWGYRLGHGKPEHEEWSKYTPEMGYRCMEDARINLQVLEALESEADMLPNYYELIKPSNSPTAGD